MIVLIYLSIIFILQCVILYRLYSVHEKRIEQQKVEDKPQGKVVHLTDKHEMDVLREAEQ